VAVGWLKEIQIHVFKKSDLLLEVVKEDEIEVKCTKALGMRWGWKGGAGVILDVQGTRITFITAHLAAHMRKMHSRNEDARRILAESHKVSHHYDLTVTSDHVFWFGDLNYRVDPQYFKQPHREYEDVADDEQDEFLDDYQTVLQTINRDDFDASELLFNDQLINQRREGNVLANFQEAEITFRPTFKVIVGEEEEYATIRIPSYCDRVLWHSLPALTNAVTNVAYTSLPYLTTSDHKPVLATFQVDLYAPPRASSRGDTIQISVMIESDNPRATELLADKLKGSARLRVVAIGHPLVIGSKQRLIGTDTTASATGTFILGVDADETTETSHIAITVYAGGESNANLLGSTSIPLDRISGDPETTASFLHIDGVRRPFQCHTIVHVL
jgi:hypothetical protein